MTYINKIVQQSLISQLYMLVGLLHSWQFFEVVTQPQIFKYLTYRPTDFINATAWLTERFYWVRSEVFFSIKHSNMSRYFFYFTASEFVVVFASMRLVSRFKRKSDLMAFYFRPGGNKHSNIWQGVWMFPISTVWEWNDTLCYRMSLSMYYKCVNSFATRLAF